MLRRIGGMLTRMKLPALSISTTVLLAFASASAGQSGAGSDDWEFSITPYLWLPSVNATLNFDVPPAGNSPIVNFDNPLSNLKMAGMLTGRAHKGDWGVFYDVVYVNIGDLKSTVHDLNGPGGVISLPLAASLDTGIKGTVASLAGTHLMVNSSRWQLDLIGGLRYADVSTSASWSLSGPDGALARSGSVSKSINFLDGVVGVLGHMQLGDSGKWYLPVELDFGAGSNNSTTANGVLGVGYKFGWGELVLAYRYLYCNLGSHGGLHDLKIDGPALGATFHW